MHLDPRAKFMRNRKKCIVHHAPRSSSKIYEKQEELYSPSCTSILEQNFIITRLVKLITEKIENYGEKFERFTDLFPQYPILCSENASVNTLMYRIIIIIIVIINIIEC